jgi:LmbE family N-acetylglucosaminyl deacetylase
MKSFRKVLILSPHTDDGELGCGGSVAKLVEEGSEVYYAAFSICEDSVPPGFPKDILETEVKQATKVLGIKPENLIIYKYPVRYHPQNRQAILEDIIRLKKEINPDLVFLPLPQDVHQDHRTVAEEGIRAFKYSSILGYELPWNDLSVRSQFFISLEQRHLDRKTEALGQYKSQGHRHYMDEEFMKALARLRGGQIGVRYAEMFEVIRWIMR